MYTDKRGVATPEIKKIVAQYLVNYLQSTSNILAMIKLHTCTYTTFLKFVRTWVFIPPTSCIFDQLSRLARYGGYIGNGA